MTRSILLLCLLFTVACASTTRPGVAIDPVGPVKPQQQKISPVDLPRARLPNTLKGGSKASGGGATADKSPYERFQANYYASASTPTDTTAARAFLDSGLAYADILCDRYFTVLANRNQDMAFAKESTAITGGLAASVLGLTGSPTKSVALTAAGFAATLAGMESYQQHYYFGPDVATVRTLITEGQDKYRATITAEQRRVMTYYGAMTHVRKMQSICQVDRIQDLVNQSVAKQEIVFERSRREDFFSRIATQGARSRLEAALSTIVTNDDLVNLYILSEEKVGDDVRQLIRENMGPGAGGLGALLIDANGATNAGFATHKTTIRHTLEALSSDTRIAIRERALLLLENMKTQINGRAAGAVANQANDAAAANQATQQAATGVSLPQMTLETKTP